MLEYTQSELTIWVIVMSLISLISGVGVCMRVLYVADRRREFKHRDWRNSWIRKNERDLVAGGFIGQDGDRVTTDRLMMACGFAVLPVELRDNGSKPMEAHIKAGLHWYKVPISRLNEVRERLIEEGVVATFELIQQIGVVREDCFV